MGKKCRKTRSDHECAAHFFLFIVILFKKMDGGDSPDRSINLPPPIFDDLKGYQEASFLCIVKCNFSSTLSLVLRSGW